MSAIVLGALLDASIRVSLLAGAQVVILAAIRVRAPAVRHRAWAIFLGAMLLMPILHRYLPEMVISLPFDLPVTHLAQGERNRSREMGSSPALTCHRAAKDVRRKSGSPWRVCLGRAAATTHSGPGFGQIRP